ncbi:glycosyltransferase [uncultured Pelagimonas sp.]|uniref:glycosyltransferase n=1 Tax=uncultured Pelagimonas sp. TaxID=1618102 RepID=UPI002617350D|nr:glycosyltransferase [uncultured Pelagimonas sp.]
MTRRVLHVSPYMDATAGGPPVVVEQLIAGAAANNYRADILTSAAFTSDNGAALSQKWPEAVILPTQRAALTGQGKAQVEEAVSKADVVHLHTMWSPLVAQAARMARRHRVPYILSPHGMLDPYSVGQKALKKRLYLALIERATLRGAARMLFTAEDERRLAEPVTGPLPSAVIALGADAPPSAPEILRSEFAQRYPDLADRSLAIFLGRLHGKKRPEAAIKAMDHLRHDCPKACLMVVGSGPEEAELRALVAQRGLSEHVRFLGFLSGRDKWQAMAAAQVFVLPSRQENFAIALAEALHAGVPALVTRKVNIWREVTEAGAGAVLNEEDLEADLAKGCRMWFADPAQQAKAGRAARALAERAFDWSISATRTHALYDEVQD